MDDSDKKFVVDTINTYNSALVDTLNKQIIAKLNKQLASIDKNFDHIWKRFDDVDKRLSRIEGNMHIVSKDTALIPEVLDTLVQDGQDIAKLEKRMTKLEE